MWGKKKKQEKRPDLFDYDTPDTPHTERKTARSMRRVIYTHGQQSKKAHETAQKKLVNEYHAKRGALANEYLREQPDYSKVFDYEHDGLAKKQFEIGESIRQWVRWALVNKMTYKQIRDIVVSEFRLHREAMNRRKD